jgi:glucose-6-phosphate 1-dehydrogenase
VTGVDFRQPAGIVAESKFCFGLAGGAEATVIPEQAVEPEDVATTILQAWEADPNGPRTYAAGSWGPPASSAMVARDGCTWDEEQ